MKQIMTLTLSLAAALFAANAQATAYDVYAYSDTHHAAWIPDLDQRHLLLDPGATLSIESDEWHLNGDLTSATDGSKWQILVNFTDVLTGPEFGVLTSYSDGRIKGTGWGNIQPDWAFAKTVTGTLTALDGDWAGHAFSPERMPGTHDYYAQFGTCLNDKNCEKGLSTWLTVTDKMTGESYRGDINVSVSAPVPEPSAAVVFGVGSLLATSIIRRSKP